MNRQGEFSWIGGGKKSFFLYRYNYRCNGDIIKNKEFFSPSISRMYLNYLSALRSNIWVLCQVGIARLQASVVVKNFCYCNIFGVDYNDDINAEEFAEEAPLTVRTLCESLGVSESFLQKLPAAARRQNGTFEAGSARFKGMVRAMRKITSHVAKLVYPGNPAELLEETGFDCPLRTAAERRRKRRQGKSAKRQGAKAIAMVTKATASTSSTRPGQPANVHLPGISSWRKWRRRRGLFWR